MTVAGIGSSAVKAGQHRKNPPVIVIGREEVQRGEDCGVVLNDHPFANHKSLRNGGVRASPQLSDFSSTDRFRIKSIGAERIVSLRILVLGASSPVVAAHDRYDLVLVPVRSEQLDSTIPVLTAMNDSSDVLFFGNTGVARPSSRQSSATVPSSVPCGRRCSRRFGGEVRAHQPAKDHARRTKRRDDTPGPAIAGRAQ
jgi:hypothetical protein